MIDIFFEKLNKYLSNFTAILMLLVMLNVFIDVVLRYTFHTGSIASQEMEWHLFAVMFLFGISYALQDESHVRVDFIYDNLSKKRKAWINIIGTIFMLIPFAAFIVYGSYEFVMDSYSVNEISEDPGGLKYRWIIKAMIPLAFFTLILSAIGYIKTNLKLIFIKK
jgi:TRAP-type mannitol/chloroaromatic compound transport system permease small subunit